MKICATNFVMDLIFFTSWRPHQLKSKSQFPGNAYKIMVKVLSFKWYFRVKI